VISRPLFLLHLVLWYPFGYMTLLFCVQSPTLNHKVFMLRTLYAYTAITLYLIFGGSLLILSVYFDTSGKTAHKIASAWGRFAIHACGITLDADLTKLTPDQTYIFVSNHQSQVDIPIFLALLAHFNISFLAKHTLFRVPVLGRVMRSLGCIPVDRGHPRKALKTLKQAFQTRTTPNSILVFPEGTRNAVLGEFKSGAIIMAIQAGLPIAPVVIAGSGKIMTKGTLRITPGTVRVAALPPIELQGNYTLKNREQLKQNLRTMMNNKLLESENG